MNGIIPRVTAFVEIYCYGGDAETLTLPSRHHRRAPRLIGKARDAEENNCTTAKKEREK